MAFTLMTVVAWRWMVVLCLLLFTLAAYAGPPSYIYDDNGRLIAVTDPSSNTAIYTYDAVGNLLSITRRSSALLSIIEFTPKRGPVGAQVTIFGTGFSTTPSQNTVRFKGVAAQVLSSSATQYCYRRPDRCNHRANQCDSRH